MGIKEVWLDLQSLKVYLSKKAILGTDFTLEYCLDVSIRAAPLLVRIQVSQANAQEIPACDFILDVVQVCLEESTPSQPGWSPRRGSGLLSPE